MIYILIVESPERVVENYELIYKYRKGDIPGVVEHPKKFRSFF